MKNLLALIFLFIFAFANAQSLKITYSEKSIISNDRLEAMPADIRVATIAEMNIPKLFELHYSEGTSIYQREKNAKDFKYRSQNNTFNEDGKAAHSSVIIDKKLTPFFYYKELDNDLMLFKISNIGITFDGKDKLISWNWEITEETKIIKGYHCKKAISNKFDVLVTAWFTEEIPVKAGPEKYDGLPGLILHLTNLGQEFTAETIEIQENLFNIDIPKQPLKTVTFLEMVEQANKEFEESIKFRKKKDDGIFTRTKIY